MIKKIVTCDCGDEQIETEVLVTCFENAETTEETQLGEILETIWENKDNIIFHKKIKELIKISKI